MTGYRSGFVAADPDLIAALKQFRPSVGTAPQEFVQRASVVAWNDEEHVERTRDAYRRKREALLPTLARKGMRVAGGRRRRCSSGSRRPPAIVGDVRRPSARAWTHRLARARSSALPARATVRLALVPTD